MPIFETQVGADMMRMMVMNPVYPGQLIKVEADTELSDCGSFLWRDQSYDNDGIGLFVEEVGCYTTSNLSGDKPNKVHQLLQVKEDVTVGDFFMLKWRELVIPPNVLMDVWQTYDDSISFEIQAAPKPVVKPVEEINPKGEKADIEPEVIKPDTDGKDTLVPTPEIVIDIPK